MSTLFDSPDFTTCSPLAGLSHKANEAPAAPAPELLQWVGTLSAEPWHEPIIAYGKQPKDTQQIAAARGLPGLRMRDEPEGEFFELKMPFPEARTVEASARGEFCKQQAITRCVVKYEQAAQNLLQKARDLHGCLPVVFQFTGNWDESFQLIQKQMVKRLVQSHYARILAAEMEN